MNIIAGYQTHEIIYSSEQTVIYRGSDRNGKSVILKILNNSHPDQEQLAKFNLEYKIIQLFNKETDKKAQVIKAYDLVKNHNSLIIVLEDINGQSLLDHLKEKKMAVGDFLSIAIQITKTLGQIHDNFVIHKDINPSNIIWNSKTKKVRIIDFGISTILSKNNMSIWNARNLEGTPAYLSPEQTGRMNRFIDSRTDIYSLGATFYHLLTGIPPFSQDETLGLVYGHLAQNPTPPSDEDSLIPKILSDIIIKMLAKEASDRYQTVAGLLRDLIKCNKQWKENEEITPFTLGVNDVFEQFSIPQILFGREKELKVLHDSFNSICLGSTELVSVEGKAGIGKSSLINELCPHVVSRGAYFIEGKFTQSENDSPFGAIVLAFQQLLRQLLSESKENLALWKEKLSFALGSKSVLLTRAIPELEFFVEPNNQQVELAPNQSLEQFQLAFLELVKTICQENHPLTLFLDDLQWSDKQSLQLLKNLLIDPDLKYFQLIFAYRDDEEKRSEHFQNFKDSINDIAIPNNTVHLAPLNKNDVSNLIAESTNCDTKAVEQLVKQCMEKTNGNPFFLKQFLNSLYVEGLIYIKNGKWHWDIAGIQKHGITDNVVDLMIQKINKLNPESQELLKIASCIGLVFDLTTLVAVTKKTPQKIVEISQELL
ncbi:MAG: AAA family ATPase [Magnetococcales bacterium]|nr:AAA family ATPase [Magnetococcales bacterium]